MPNVEPNEISEIVEREDKGEKEGKKVWNERGGRKGGKKGGEERGGRKGGKKGGEERGGRKLGGREERVDSRARESRTSYSEHAGWY